MAEHPQPEMTRLSLQDLALRIKIMKIGTGAIEETLLKALDPPLVVNIQRAVSSLIEVRILLISSLVNAQSLIVDLRYRSKRLRQPKRLLLSVAISPNYLWTFISVTSSSCLASSDVSMLLSLLL